MVILICDIGTPWLKTVLNYIRRAVAEQPASATRACGSIEVLRLHPLPGRDPMLIDVLVRPATAG
jgi:hypothetical protein